MLKRYNKLVEAHQKQKSAYATQQGKLETYYEQLGELGHTSIKSAKADMSTIHTRLEELGAEIEEQLQEYEVEFGL